jgi:hypothetical protein
VVALGEELYAADYIALVRWDGVEWTPLGSGILGQINTIAASGTNFVVGGKFDCAGGKVSNGFAVWHQPPAPLKLRITGDPSSTNKLPAKPMVVSWPRAFTNLVAEESPNLVNGPWTRVKQSQFLFGSHTVITSPPPAMNLTNRFFRLRNAP